MYICNNAIRLKKHSGYADGNWSGQMGALSCASRHEYNIMTVTVTPRNMSLPLRAQKVATATTPAMGTSGRPGALGAGAPGMPAIKPDCDAACVPCAPQPAGVSGPTPGTGGSCTCATGLLGVGHVRIAFGVPAFKGMSYTSVELATRLTIRRRRLGLGPHIRDTSAHHCVCQHAAAVSWCQ